MLAEPVRVAARLVLAVAVLLGPVALGAHLAHAQDDEGYEDDQGYDDGGQYAADTAPDPGSYGEALDPYGSWIDDDQYGRAWQPAVSVDWAPYTDGYWAWTPYGWTWVSSEPWGWTFHYGRWALLPGGWAWVPGTIWGPAWVDWFWGDGFVGWAPLPPFAAQVLVIEEFVFVHEGDFCSHDLVHQVVNHHLVPDHVIHRWQHHDGRSGHPPGRHHTASGGAAPRRSAPQPDAARQSVAARAPRAGGGAGLPGSPSDLADPAALGCRPAGSGVDPAACAARSACGAGRRRRPPGPTGHPRWLRCDAASRAAWPAPPGERARGHRSSRAGTPVPALPAGHARRAIARKSLRAAGAWHL